MGNWDEATKKQEGAVKKRREEMPHCPRCQESKLVSKTERGYDCGICSLQFQAPKV